MPIVEIKPGLECKLAVTGGTDLKKRAVWLALMRARVIATT